MHFKELSGDKDKGPEGVISFDSQKPWRGWQRKVIFVPNVRAQSSSGEWLQGRQRNPAGKSLSWWLRTCFPAHTQEEEKE